MPRIASDIIIAKMKGKAIEFTKPNSLQRIKAMILRYWCDCVCFYDSEYFIYMSIHIWLEIKDT